MDLGFNNNSNFDPLSIFIQLKKKLLISGVTSGSLMSIIVFAVIIWSFLSPINAVVEFATDVADTAQDTAENIGTFFSKTWNLITLGHFEKTENAWYAEINNQYEKYAEKGIYLDRALIASALFYDQPMDLEEDYVENISEEDFEKYNDVEELDKAIESEEDFSAGKDLNYRLLVFEAGILSKGFAEAQSKQTANNDEIRNFLKNGFMEYKLKSLGRHVPEDTEKNKEARDKMFEEAVNFIYLKRDVYADLFEKETGQCEFTQNPDSESRQKVRTTVYSSHDDGYSLGGTLGDIRSYFKKGYVYLNDDGYYMWKGGNKSNRGQIYGETGTDYLIVAVSTKAKDVIGKNVTVGKCKVKVNELDDIPYFNYGDTFTMQLTTDNGKTYKMYNSIALDTCGACMVYSPSYPCISKMEGSKLKETNNTKIDVYVDKTSSNYKRPADYGYYMSGTSSGTCVGTIDLGALVTNNKGLNLLNKSAVEVLGQQWVNELSQQIAANVDKYGKGTGNAAAAAAITLLNGFRSKGYYLPYFWGGGHGKIATGVPPTIGASTRITADGSSAQPVGSYWPYSFDCSGFVSWAMYNAGCKNFTPSGSGSFASLGPAVKGGVKNAKPGDILTKKGHVFIVVQNNNGKVITAEAANTNDGMMFAELTEKRAKDYKIVDMSEYYAKNCK